MTNAFISQSAVKLSFSQNGEDRILESFLRYIFEKDYPYSYLDIGSNNPIFNNNTYLSYIHGGSGVLIEPNPIFKDISRIMRPRDIFYNVGISIDGSKDRLYYDFGIHHELNTFDSEIGEHVEENWKHISVKLKQKIKLQLLDINEIISAHFSNSSPDIFSIDCEGYDAKIIQNIDFTKFRPKLICMERWSDPEHNMENWLKKHNYMLATNTFVNDIYINADNINNKQFTPIRYDYTGVLYTYPPSNGKLVYCGMDLIKIFDNSVSNPENWGGDENKDFLSILCPYEILPDNFILNITMRAMKEHKILIFINSEINEIQLGNTFSTFPFTISGRDKKPVILRSAIPSMLESDANQDNKFLGIEITEISFTW